MSSWMRLVVLIVSVASLNGLRAGEALYQFDGDLTSGTGHVDLVPVDQAPGGGPSVTFGTAMIGDAEASVATLGGNTTLHMNPDAAPNGGGNYVNDYTIVVDMAIPGRGDDCSGSWVSFFNTNATNTNDGDMFVNPGGGLGISGDYEGCVDGGWHRIAMSMSADPALMQCYVDGVLVNEVNLDGVDGRWSLYSNAGEGFQGLYLFGDESGDVPPEIVVNSALFVDRRLSADDIACLGGPSAAGISTAFNDTCDCATGIELAAGGTRVVDGSTSSATFDGVADCGTSNTAPGVWYSFVGTGSDVFVGTCGDVTNFDTKLGVFTGGCDALACVAGNDDNCPGFRSSVTIPSVEGETYRVLVHGFGASIGDFQLTLQDLSPAGNDLCEDATEVALDFSQSTFSSVTLEGGDTRAGTPDAENDACGNSDAPGVWYHVAGSGGGMTASTCLQATYDTRISVFAGECGALECVTENDDGDDDAGNDCGLSSFARWDSATGTDYFVLVHGFSAGSGTFNLTVTGNAPPCVKITQCQPNQDDNSVSIAWESANRGQDGYEILLHGQSIGTLGVDATSFTHSPELAPGRLNDLVYTVVATGVDDPDCEDSCVATLSPGSICFADDFNSYEDDIAVELAGYFLLDENAPAENATWTVTNPANRVNPPTADGSPTSGGFLISDSDAAGGANPPGSGMSHDIWSPSFSLEGKDNAYLHLDMSAQLNNNGEALVDIDVSTDGGGSWENVFRRIAPRRSVAPQPEAGNVDGYYGRLDVDLSSAAGESDVRFRVRHFEPNDDWWIAIDNVLVDDIPPTSGGADTLFEEDFSTGLGGMSAISANGNTCSQSWHTTDKGNRDVGANGGDFTIYDGRGVGQLGGQSDGTVFTACLDGAQEVPPVETAASGTATIVVDPETLVATLHLEFDGLSSPQTDAHIHLGAAGVVGEVALPLPPDSPVDGPVQLDEESYGALLAGLYYINVHTETNPDGEIRGQILPNSGFAIIESDTDPDPEEDEWLVTPSIDCSEATEVFLHYDSETSLSGLVQDVIVSLDGGATYESRPLFSYTAGALYDYGEDPFAAQRVLAVPAAAGQSDVVFAFRWVGSNDWFWAIDNVRVSATLPVVGGLQSLCDYNQDGGFDLSDGVGMLNHLFLGGPPPPCGDNTLGHPANVYLLDCNGDGGVDLSDGICKLNFLFLGGPAPANSAGGTDNCQRIVDCPDSDCDEGA